MTATVPTPTIRAMANGGITRTITSWRASTSRTMRARRSPRRKAGSPPGATRSSRRYTTTRQAARTRKAASWPTNRSS